MPMPMPQRKPFIPPASIASGGGAPAPGMGMPPTPNGVGPQPPMPMGGAPGGAPPMGGPPMPGPSPAMGGGPTSPFNISSMLQSQQQQQQQEQQQQQAQQPQIGAPMPPWGDQGQSSLVNPNAPKRVPLSGSGFDANNYGSQQSMDDGSGDAMTANSDVPGMQGGPTVMMRLLRSLGKI